MKKLNNKGFVLLETLIVAVFVITIFSFIYSSVIPLLGRYEYLIDENNVENAYALYHIRDCFYKDSNYENIIKSDYAIIVRDSKWELSQELNDIDYYDNLTKTIFLDSDYTILYVRKLASRYSVVCSSLGLDKDFSDYIEKIATTKTSSEKQNFIFLKHKNSLSYLSLAINLDDPTNYKEPQVENTFNHKDTSNANKPILANGMIPVRYDLDEVSWVKADPNNKSDLYYWYDYNLLQWANVVLVKPEKLSFYKNESMGAKINLNDVLCFYVWIPRYEYYIEGNYGRGATSNTLPGEIEVNFIDSTITGNRTVDSKTFRVPDAFKFSTNINGLWFSKFEAVESSSFDYKYNDKTIYASVPNKNSWNSFSIGELYNNVQTNMNGSNGISIYGLEKNGFTVDSHIMKNEEWGAVAYFSQSKYGKYANTNYEGSNKEVYINNRLTGSQTTITGSSQGEPSNAKTKAYSSNCSNSSATVATSKESVPCYKYNVEGKGTGASTTGNIYGIYDMSGGNPEVVMGTIKTSRTECGTNVPAGRFYAWTGFNGPFSETSRGACYSNGVAFPTDTKYYTIYPADTSKSLKLCTNGRQSGVTCYSHAMSETANWYSDYAVPGLSSSASWFVRGGPIASNSGIFVINAVSAEDTADGIHKNLFSSRVTIIIY